MVSVGVYRAISKNTFILSSGHLIISGVGTGSNNTPWQALTLSPAY